MALGFMRRHRRWLYFFLWIVILAFLVLYVPAFSNMDRDTPGETLATVGGRTIKAGEFQRAYVQQRQRLEQMYQGRLNAGALRSLHIEEQVFQEMVDGEIVRLEAARLGLTIDDATLAREISSAPQFQRDGQFIGVDELRRLAEMGGMPLDVLEQGFRQQLLRERLQALVGDVVSVSESDAEREYRRRNEQVKLEYVQVSTESQRAAVTVTEAEVSARFKQNPEAYGFPERRIVSYVLVDPEELRTRVTVTPADVETYYRDHADDFREEEQVCASHVLIKVKAAPDAAEGHTDDEAKKIAEGLLLQARSGADFAELAKKSSEDQGSASSGGDLGCFGRGRMVPEFENAAFDQQVGTLSDLVRSSYGYHIIRVGARREASVPALKQVEERIRQELTSERGQALQTEKADAVSAALRAGRTLDEAATEQGLGVQKSTPFARGDSPTAFLTPAVVARAFGLKPGQSDPEGARARAGQVFIQLAEVQPPRLPELAEVREKVKADLLDQKASAAAREKLDALRAQAEQDGLDRAATVAGEVRKETPALVGRGQPLGDLGSSATLDEAAFALAPKALSAPVRTPSGWAVLRVLERTAFDASAYTKERDALVTQLRDERRGRVFQSYMQDARRRYPVERHADVFRRVVG